MSRGAAAACASTSVVHAAAIAGGRRYVIAAGLGRVELPICAQASVFSSICCRQLQLQASLLFRHCSIILLAYPSLALDQLLLLRLKSIAGAELVLSLAPRVLLPVACRPGLLGCIEGLQSIQAGQHQRCARLAAAVKEQEQGRPNLPNLPTPPVCTAPGQLQKAAAAKRDRLRPRPRWKARKAGRGLQREQVARQSVWPYSCCVYPLNRKNNDKDHHKLSKAKERQVGGGYECSTAIIPASKLAPD